MSESEQELSSDSEQTASFKRNSNNSPVSNEDNISNRKIVVSPIPNSEKCVNKKIVVSSIPNSEKCVNKKIVVSRRNSLTSDSTNSSISKSNSNNKSKDKEAEETVSIKFKNQNKDGEDKEVGENNTNNKEENWELGEEDKRKDVIEKYLITKKSIVVKRNSKEEASSSNKRSSPKKIQIRRKSTIGENIEIKRPGLSRKSSSIVSLSDTNNLTNTKIAKSAKAKYSITLKLQNFNNFTQTDLFKAKFWFESKGLSARLFCLNDNLLTEISKKSYILIAKGGLSVICPVNEVYDEQCSLIENNKIKIIKDAIYFVDNPLGLISPNNRQNLQNVEVGEEKDLETKEEEQDRIYRELIVKENMEKKIAEYGGRDDIVFYENAPLLDMVRRKFPNATEETECRGVYDYRKLEYDLDIITEQEQVAAFQLGASKMIRFVWKCGEENVSDYIEYGIESGDIFIVI